MAASSRKSSLLREVSAPASNSWRWKTLTICTGASASTLQDIKVAESCGGYSYLDSGAPGSCVRNRFIYWRTYQDVLELVEESLDLSLSGNMVRYRFQDCPIIPQVSVHEVSSGHVIVLVATVASVHRLVFPHPTKINRQQGFVLSEQNATSIFYDASLPDDTRNQFLLTPGGSITSHLLCASSCMCSDGHALFAMATNAGGIQLIKLPPIGVAGVVIQHELSCSSLMKKIWSGLVPAVMKGQSVPETAVSIELLPLQGDVYIFTVCKDFRFRIWSSKQRECILVENLLDYNSDDMDSTANPATLNVSGHVIKSIQGVNNAGVCVYLALNNHTKFMFLNPVPDGGRLTMELVYTLSRASNEDLVDFVVTDDFLISLWSTQAGDHVVLAKKLFGEESQREWEPVHLVSPQEYVMVPPHRDARDVFLEKIFSPGYFSTQDILKALSVFKRSPTSNLELESMGTLDSLKEQVTNALDTEIRNSALDGEMQEDVYTQLQNEQWEKFYSCCHQYKQIGEKPKGLFADPVTGLFGIIKKSTFSVLRPCDRAEELYLSPTLKMSNLEIERSDFTLEDVTPSQFADDVRLMCDCVQLVSGLMPPEASAIFLSSCQSLESPEGIVEKLYEMISEDGSPRALTNLLLKMTKPVVALDYLLYLTEISADSGMDWEPDAERLGHHHFSGLFAGNLGVSFMCQVLQQMVSLRFSFIRDLLVVAKALVVMLRKQSDSSRSMLGMVTREIIPKGNNLLRCYKVLVWASNAVTSTNLNSTVDFNLQQLTNLGIKDKMVQGGSTKFNTQPGYVVQSFLESSGGDQCRSLLSCQQEGNSRDVWRNNLCDMVHSLALLIWPATDDTVFPEFLIRSCQYLCLQHYVHLLTPWCTWNESSRSFFLALAYLHFNEPLKALKLFIKASDGVGTENFLSQKLLQTQEDSHYRLQTLYYLKVMKQFEFYGLPDLVIVLAMEAVNEASHDDPELATLQSEVFRQHLELGHNQLAFTAMMNNPDRELKKSSLRQFLAVLCERGNLSDLVSFDYKDLEEEVVYILEKKARSVDISTHDYYSLLFSFFIYREDYRKAGRVMFEKGLRLGQEVSGLNSLQQQAQCYLFTLNCLRLVKPQYAWIIKPSLRQDNAGGGGHIFHNAKERQYVDGNGKMRSAGKNQMEILELADLERQYLMLDARLRLIRRDPERSLHSGPMPSPMEMLSLLCSAGLYDVAVHITKAFNLSSEPVLSSLSLRCITLAMNSYSNSKSLLKDSTGTSSSAAPVWLWLKENEVPPCGAKELSPADQSWALLQSYLTRLEDGSGLCHKCVAYTLLSQGFHPPTWLVNSYKVVDVSSLLRVYLTFDLLVPASKLAMEYLQGTEDVVRGVDVPKFGLKKVIPTSQFSVWVPYTSLDQLLVALREQDNPTYVDMYKKLSDRIQDYQNKVYSLSQQLKEA